jgi:hypothetical protein
MQLSMTKNFNRKGRKKFYFFFATFVYFAVKLSFVEIVPQPACRSGVKALRTAPSEPTIFCEINCFIIGI